MIRKLRYLQAAVRTLPDALRSGFYYFLKGWDTLIKREMLDYGKALNG